MKNYNNFKLFESPDNINLIENFKRIKGDWETIESQPFAFYPKMKKNEKDSLGNLLIDYDKNRRMIPNKIWVGKKMTQHFQNIPMVHKGRLWFSYDNIKLNIISIWGIEDITKKQMQFIIKKLEKETDINFSDWRIDIGREDESDKHSEIILIPLKDYKGGIILIDFEKKYREKELNWHLMSPKEKEKYKRNIPKNTGSKNKKKNIKTRNLLGKFRGESIMNFSEFKK